MGSLNDATTWTYIGIYYKIAHVGMMEGRGTQNIVLKYSHVKSDPMQTLT